MIYTLGVDIGTFESKGVLVDSSGAIVAQATNPHEMLVPQPGWAEHRADEDWWGDFVRITRKLLATSGVPAEQIGAVACSAIGPCMLPVDAGGAPLMNGVIPHPALVALFEDTAEVENIPLQRSAQVGVLTDLSYVQTVGAGVASLDIGFPMRYSHSANEMCDLRDLEGLTTLTLAALSRIGPDFSLNRDDYP